MTASNTQPITTQDETFTSFSGPVTSRSDFRRVCISLLKPLIPFFSPLHSRVRLGATGTRFDETGAQLEGFARPLWGLAALLASDGSDDPDLASLTRYWSGGLKQGTDPASPEYWGDIRDFDQRMVELCPIGFALAVAGPRLLAGWTEVERRRLGAWVRGINVKKMPETNWLWFRVWANLGLREVGEEYNAERIEKDLDHLETFYRGGGWSNDGPEGYTQMDSYSGSFAIQFLQLLYVKVNGENDPRRAGLFRERARMFAADSVLYHDPQGRHVTFGRSLTYRFAMAGFWSACAFADLDLPGPLSWGVVKGLLLRNCRWWMEQKDMLSPQGTLTIGYCYPNQFVSENYNSPGSPYWFMLSFAALACPENHPFWNSREETHPNSNLPSSSLPVVKALHQPLHIVVNNRAGHTFILSSGQMCHYPVRAGAAKYSKFAYSSAFGYSVPTGEYFIEAVGVDNTLGFSDDVPESGFGETWKVRRVATNARIETIEGGPVLVSGWNPWPDVVVDTWLVPPDDQTPSWHLRIHRIQTGRKLRAVEGAWALHGYESAKGSGERELGLLADGMAEGRYAETDSALAVSLRSGVVGIHDLVGNGRRAGKVLDADANSNLIWARTVIPTLSEDLVPGDERWYVTAVFAVPESSTTSWLDSWRAGWNARPQIPSWVTQMMSQSIDFGR